MASPSARPPTPAPASRPSTRPWMPTALGTWPAPRTAPPGEPRRRPARPARQRTLATPTPDPPAPTPTTTPPPLLGPLGPLAPGQVLIESSCQADTYDALAARAVALAEADPGGRVVIALAGGPGSGKSTAAAGVASRVSSALPPLPGAPSGAASAVFLPMDGFHYTRAQLDAGVAGDPPAAHARRGAPWTFDAAAFAAAVAAAAVPGTALDAPSFDHGAGDPAPGGAAIRPWHRVVIVEGNYVLCENGAWAGVAQVATEKWFLGCPLKVAMKRVTARQRRQGRPAGVVARRIAQNDRPNAVLVNRCVGRADVVARTDLPAGKGSGGKGERVEDEEDEG